MSESRPKPSWNPWPLGLTLSLGSVLVGVIGFSVFAQRHRADLVTPDYYREEIAYQRQIDRQQRALELDQAPVWELVPDRNMAVLSFDPSSANPSSGTIHLYRPSDSELDRLLPLDLDEERDQEVPLDGLAEGLWIVRLTWTTESEEFYHEERWLLPLAEAAS